MSYQVIARKWRPQTFEEVTGQEAITRTLRNAIAHDRLHHAYIFSGSRGVGKTTTARLVAKSLNCHKTESPNPTPCSLNDPEICVSCREISESRSIDVFEFDAASHTGVDDIRELILESININPARDRFKIFIIDEVHMLSNSSFNALLKTLEEPPARVQFVMATTELHKLPDTILSRCQEFEFRSIPSVKIFERLKLIAQAEKIDISDAALKELARSGEGSMRDAQSNFDQVISFSDKKIGIDEVIVALGIASSEMLTKTVAAIAENKPSDVLRIVDELIGRGQDLRNFCRDMLSFFRDLLITKIAGDVDELLDTAILSGEELRKFAEPFSESDLIRFFNSLSETELRLHGALQPRYLLEIGLIKLIEMRRVTPIENLLERLANIENALPEYAKSANAGTSPSPADQEKKTLVSEKTAENDPNADEFETHSFPIDKIALQNSGPESGSARDDVEIEGFTDLPAREFVVLDEPSDFIERFTANIADSDFLDLSPISSEDLEHADDTWLDAAYEKKLGFLGDDLSYLPNAVKFFEQFARKNVSAESKESENKEFSAAAGAGNRADFSHLIPTEEIYDPDAKLPELPEDPNDEQLKQFAEHHPAVRRALKIFRGKITEIKKLS